MDQRDPVRRSILQGRPVWLRPVRATSCFTDDTELNGVVVHELISSIVGIE